MKKSIITISLMLLTVFLFLFVSGLILSDEKDDIREVSVEKAYLKEQPKNFSKTLKILELFDKVDVLDKDGTWLHVETADSDKLEGYIQESVVSTEELTSDVSDSVSYGQSATAGARGFNEETEDSYKDKNPQYDYESVDRAEKMTDAYSNPFESFAEFREEGSLGEYAMEQ